MIANPLDCAFVIIGVIKPEEVAVAIEMSALWYLKDKNLIDWRCA